MSENKIITIQYQSPCGILALGSTGGRLCLCDWLNEPHHSRVMRRMSRMLDAAVTEGDSDVTEQAAVQLDEYFAGLRQGFDIDLLVAGTDFQEQVWMALRAIPFGTTLSYGELARRIGRPAAVRAVANAIGSNPLSIFIPCHRVTGSDRRLTGYAGGLAAKEFLLKTESVVTLGHTYRS